jgi:hypothetical protein
VEIGAAQTAGAVARNVGKREGSAKALAHTLPSSSPSKLDRWPHPEAASGKDTSEPECTNHERMRCARWRGCKHA